MSRSNNPSLRSVHSIAKPSLAFVLLNIMFIILWLAGGASLPGVPAQLIIRATCLALLVIAVLFCPRFSFVSVAPVWILLGTAVALVTIQLIPLPPAVWQSLPGRSLFAEAAAASGQSPPWRPLAIAPGGAINALFSLTVPLTALVLLSGLRAHERTKLPAMILMLAVASLLVGLLQFTGAGLTNALVNSEDGGVDGLFANRNHFALLMAIGCAVAPAWAFSSRSKQHARWRAPTVIALVVLFILAIIASGSRAGMFLGAFGIAAGLLLARRDLARDFSRRSRIFARTGVIIAILAPIAIVAASFLTGRAVSIDRVLALTVAEDLRAQNLPVVLAMTRDYSPVGTGFGSFDNVFRIREPATSLQKNYFNHAHNDFIEITLEGGVAGAVLLCCGLAWGIWAGSGAWLEKVRSTNRTRDENAESISRTVRMGSAVLFLVAVASVVDYPARTPTIMTILIVAAVCMCKGFHGTALRFTGQRL